jgi:type II secretory pathway pseudopilin PulG
MQNPLPSEHNWRTKTENNRPLARLFSPQVRPEEGMTIVEIAVGAALISLVTAMAIATLIVLNKNAVSTRIMTNAREIVQRNIEAAIAIPFTSSNIPPILATATNAVWDDDGGDPSTVAIYTSRDGTSTMSGRLLRTVQAETNIPGADIRRVTFRLDNYSLYGRPMNYELTTIRAVDK